MCKCLNVEGTPLWESICKCSHAAVYMTQERFLKGQMVRHWECRQVGCSRTWDVNMGFANQAQLEGRV